MRSMRAIIWYRLQVNGGERRGERGRPRFRAAVADSPIAHAIALAHHSAFGLGGADFRNIDAGGFVGTVWPGCFKKEVFVKAGPLNEGA